MKLPRFLLIAVAALIAAAVVVCYATAKSAGSSDGSDVLDQYTQLILSLTQRGDTNTATQIAELVSAMHDNHAAAEIAINVRILESLRSGQTNDAIKLLEVRLDGALMTFGSPRDRVNDPKYDKILKMAKDYRAKYPHASGTPEIDSGVLKAFDSLPK